MDFERRIIGMTFFGQRITPFLLTEIVVRSLEHFKYFSALKQPCLCIRGQPLHSLDISNLEKIRYMCPYLSCGIMVKKISGVLSACFGGIEIDDIICSTDGVALYSVAQITSKFLDATVIAMHSQHPVILQADIKRPRDKIIVLFLQS